MDILQIFKTNMHRRGGLDFKNNNKVTNRVSEKVTECKDDICQARKSVFLQLHRIWSLGVELHLRC